MRILKYLRRPNAYLLRITKVKYVDTKNHGILVCIYRNAPRNESPMSDENVSGEDDVMRRRVTCLSLCSDP